MKWLSWLRRSPADEKPTGAGPRPAAVRPPRARPGSVDWERLDNPADANDPFATGSFEALAEGDPRQREALDELAVLREQKDRARQSYNPYDTSAFKVRYSNQPEREGIDEKPPRPRRATYDPYDTSTFHGSWNKQPR